MIAGYGSFLADPQLNLAKMLIALFGVINTSIILSQIHCIYAGKPRRQFVHEDSSVDGINDSQRSDENDIVF